jgi:hypothetical protein
MKPWIHCKSSVKKWGGTPDNYLPIHDFLDHSKGHLPDMRHRALLHSSFGIYIVERVFGTLIINSDNVEVSTRDVAEQHVLEDMRGFIPTVQDWLRDLPFTEWTGGRPARTRRIEFSATNDNNSSARSANDNAEASHGHNQAD